MSSAVQAGYAGLFFGAALLGLWGAIRVRRVGSPEVRRGLFALVVLAEMWALAELVRVLVGPGPLAFGAYVVGIVVGLASVGAWLYFAAAYAGRGFHRDRRVRAAAVGAFLLVVGVKLTNPLHGRYFATTAATDPFPYLAVELSPVHWAVLTATYVLSGYGIYLVGRTLTDATDDGTVTALLLLAVTLPGLCTLLGEFTPLLLPFNYEPVGAVVFAVTVLFVTDGSLVSLDRVSRHQTFDDLTQPAVVVDDEGDVSEFNAAAGRLFPALARGAPARGAFGRLYRDGESDEPVGLECGGEHRWFLVDVAPVTVGAVTLGRSYVLTEVTELERHRRELDRQNAQLEELNLAVRHELRNSLTALFGYTGLARESLERGDAEGALADLAVVEQTFDRLERTVDDLGTLTRLGQTMSDVTDCDLPSTVRRARDRLVERGELEVRFDVDREATVTAHQLRLERLFENVLQFAAHNGASEVRVGLTETGFVVADDGDPLTADSPCEVFEFGGTVPDATAGTLLPTVRLLCDVHGWQVAVDPSYEAGVRLVFDGVDVTLGECLVGDPASISPATSTERGRGD